MRLSSAGPSTQRDRAARKSQSGETGEALRLIPLPQGAGDIGEVEHVVDGFGSAGADFDGANPLIFRQPDRDHEIAIDIGAACGNMVSVRKADNQIRLAELPSGGKDRQRRGLAWISFRHAGFNPSLQQSDLTVRETALIAVDN